MQTIFIHIASYRDSELVKTIDNALQRAKYPQRLTFGICMQDTTEDYEKFPYKNHPQVKIIFILYTDTKGCCFARHKADSLFNDENYILQLDSHHRFIQNWDTILINYLHKCPSKKPILSTYVNTYETGGLNDITITDTKPCRMHAYKFDNNLVMFRPNYITNNNLFNDIPQPTLFISGHFIFTYGYWKHEVPYDPLLYFTGEEHTLAVRSFTNGWDIFYPPIPIICHMYTRQGRTKQWDDDKEWWKLDDVSKQRVHNILTSSTNYGVYGLGKLRSLDEYQKISGIDYNKKTISINAYKGIPNYIYNLYKTIDLSTFCTQDHKIWYEYSKNKKFKFFELLALPHQILLRDKERNIDISLQDGVCNWKKIDQTEWNLLQYGLFVHNPDNK